MQIDGCYSIIINEAVLEKIEEELTDFTIEDTMVTKERLELIYKILGKQDILTGKIFCLKFYMEASIEKISKLLGISERMVNNRYYRSLKSIKRKLKEGSDDL